MLWVALLFLVAEGVLSLECPAQKDAEVLILGAGMAGITAARTLHDSGITNIKILEANSERIGGRMRNASLMGIQVETGAYWIHESPENLQPIGGPRVNPIWTLARDPSKCFAEVLKGNYSDESEYMDTNSTGQYNVVDARSIIEEFDKLFDKIFENDSDISIRDALRYEGWNPDTLLKQLVEWSRFDYSYSTTTDRSSLPLLIAEYDQYKFEGESDFIVTDQRGYVSIVHCIAEPISSKIELGAVVTSINWNDECFCADVAGQGRVCGDYGITTFSIGVLQNFLENGRFNGTLSNRKTAAIKNSEMAVYHSISVGFPSPAFWNTNTDIIYRTDTRYGYYPVLESIGKGIPGSPAIVLMAVTDDEAKRVSTLTKDEIYNEIMDVMRLTYGSDIPNATDIEYYDWYSDEFYRGMFSNIPLNLTLEEKENLAVPEGRLYLSGEGVMVYSTGTVHAAYCSGIDSATDILEKKGLTERSTFLPKCEDEATPPSSAYSVRMSLITFIMTLLSLFFAAALAD